jgi:hypothetical protein
VTQFSLTTYGSALAYGVWRFHASNMNLFLLSVLCVARDFLDTADSISQLSLILQWRFQGHQSLFFRWRFLVGWDAVFTDDSTRQRWLCFLYWFHSSTVNKYALSITSVSRDSIFKDDFSFYSDSVFDDDLWISTGIVCLRIPCVKHESIFAIGFMRRSWFLRHCRLHNSAVTHTSVAI